MNYPVSHASIFRRGLVLLGLVSLSALNAETLVQYNFNSATFTQSSSGTNVTPNLLVFGTGSGITRSSTSGSGSPAGSLFTTGASADEAISGTSNDFISFKIDATSGNNMDLSALTFEYGYTFTGSTVTTADSATFEIRSSLDGYAGTIGSFTQSAQNTSSSAITWSLAGVGLAASIYQNLDTITFRIIYSDTSTSSSAILRFDNITLSGVSDASTANIPETSSYALLVGAGGLLFVMSGRRSRTT
jgi:hypothetical protein